LENWEFENENEEEQEKNKSWLPFAVVFGVFLIIILGIIQDEYYYKNMSDKKNLISVETAQSEYDLFFSSLEIFPIDDLKFLSGELLNRSKTEYSTILIDIEFYDKDGKMKEKTTERIRNLKPNQSWSFKEDFNNQEIVDYKIMGILVQPINKN
jgi:hypothetical protein